MNTIIIRCPNKSELTDIVNRIAIIAYVNDWDFIIQKQGRDLLFQTTNYDFDAVVMSEFGALV